MNFIKNCEFLVTDSFHAACFSIIFNKPLVYLLNDEKLYTRLNNLFSHYKIKPYIVTKNDYIKKLSNFSIPEYDFTFANKQVKEDSKRFKEWMIRAMNKEINSNHEDSFMNEIGRIKHENFQLKQDKEVLENRLRDMTQHANNLQEMYNDVHKSFS